MAELCICTEPPSDDARRAGMSWGGVSETIRGACPLCQGDAGCPPQCRSLKPYGYADAPQWQKDAWDSDTNRIMMEAAKLLDAPEKFSWCAPSEVIYGFQNADFTLPAVSVPRGGLYWPRYRVETYIQKKPRAFRRTRWNLHVRYWDPAQQRHAHHIMEGFPARNLAVNAEQIIKFAIKNINDQVQEEKNAR